MLTAGHWGFCQPRCSCANDACWMMWNCVPVISLLVLCAGVTFSMARWMPETRPVDAPRTRLLTSYKTLFGNGGFNCYLLMLIGGLAGIAAFEACSGVLMGAGVRAEQYDGQYFVYSADSGGIFSGMVCRAS